MHALSTQQGYAEAVEALNANRSLRFDKLDALERYVNTRQYDGRPHFYDEGRGGNAVPLWERAPLIAYPIVKAAIKSNVDLALGENRFPTVTVQDEIAEEDDPEALATENVELIDRGIARIINETKFRRLARQVLTAAQGSKSACAIFGVRNGKLFGETVKAKWCEPKFDIDGNVTELEIRYAYLDLVRQPDGSMRVTAFIYRRVISESFDITFLPAKADKQGQEPEWVADPQQSFEHGFKFAPVVWYAHLKEVAVVNDIDGEAIHEDSLDEIEAHDFAISQRHRAALFVGEPQFIEIGVQPGYSPTETADTPVVHATEHGGAPSKNNPQRGTYHDGSTGKPARKKGPGYVWQYASKDTKVELISLPPGALDAIDNHAKDLRTKIAESLSVVFLDPENSKMVGNASGKMLRMLRQRQLDRVNQIREDFEEDFLLPALWMLMRIAKHTGAEKLRLRGKDKLIAALELIDDAQMPFMRAIWGKLVEADVEEERAIVEMTVAALKAHVITPKMALEKLKQVYDIGDADQALEDIEEEKQKAVENAQMSGLQNAQRIGNGNVPGMRGSQLGGKPQPSGKPGQFGKPKAPEKASVQGQR